MPQLPEIDRNQVDFSSRALWREELLWLWGATVPLPFWSGPQLMSARGRNPVPCPWLVDGLVSAVSVQQLAATLPDGPARTQVRKSADTAIAQIIDDYCGAPPRLVPWPWPGPPPWSYAVASELTAIANTMHGDMREALLAVAAQVVTAATMTKSGSAPV